MNNKYATLRIINNPNNTLNRFLASFSSGFTNAVIEMMAKAKMNMLMKMFWIAENNNMNPAIRNDINAASLLPNIVANVVILLFISGV